MSRFGEGGGTKGKELKNDQMVDFVLEPPRQQLSEGADSQRDSSVSDDSG